VRETWRREDILYMDGVANWLSQRDGKCRHKYYTKFPIYHRIDPMRATYLGWMIFTGALVACDI
jgi:hypothetical protein